MFFLAQTIFGTYIRFRLPTNGEGFHPARNIIHVILGLGTFVLAAYQVRAPLNSEYESFLLNMSCGRPGPDYPATLSLMRESVVRSSRSGLRG